MRLIHLQETDSTNRFLREECDTSNDDLTVVVADFQTAGRGQGTNRWESERGQNLLFSICMHPTWVEARRQFILSMAVANVLRRVLERLLLTDVEVKWPNDIYVGGRKICGILIETRLTGQHFKDCIVGVGLNVNQQRFVSDAPNPVSMAQLAGREFSREQVLQELLREFQTICQHWDADGIAAEYRAHLYRREGWHRYRDSHGEFMAEMVSVEDDGRLVLCDEKRQTRTFAFKEVSYVEELCSKELSSK